MADADDIKTFFEEEIPAEAMDLVTKRVAKLNRRAEKIGAPTLTLTFGEPYVKVVRTGEIIPLEVKGPDGETYVDDKERAEECVVATLTGPLPILSGWSFVATLSHEDEGVILRRMPGSDEDIDLLQYADADPRNCDHCHKVRQRTRTFIVVDESGALMQVGGSCLKDFLGHPNPLEWTRWLEESGSMFEGFGRAKRLESVEDFTTHCATMIRTHGWVRSGDWDGTPTKRAAEYNIFFVRHSVRDRRTGNLLGVSPTSADEELAAAALAWINDPKLDTGSSEYMHNLRVAASGEYVSEKNYGVLASLIATYERAKGEEVKRAARKERAAESDHEGTPETRQRLEFTVENRTSFPNNYNGGVIHKHILRSAAGNVLIWRSNNGTRLDIGETYTGTFRIERHDIHETFGKQTIINRPGKDLTCTSQPEDDDVE